MTVDGRALAQDILARAKAHAARLPRPPKVVAYVPQEVAPATRSYLAIKQRSAEAAGCAFEETRDPAAFRGADAVIVQLPVPPEEHALLDRIPLAKDADVLSRAARERFERGDADALLPPVVGAVAEILSKANVIVKGKHAAVVGDGFLVGTPAAAWLTREGADVATVTIDTPTKERDAALAQADIIVSGAGVPRLITPDTIKEGVALIDAGTSELGGKLAGDADPACAEQCTIFTPVPGGVGPVAVAKLFENAVTLAEKATKR